MLEIGLGYGTVAQVLSERGWRYCGLDIANGPVEMARHRLRMLGESDVEERVITGSAHAIPHDDESFDAAVTIGCLHHTGDIEIGRAHV